MERGLSNHLNENLTWRRVRRAAQFAARAIRGNRSEPEEDHAEASVWWAAWPENRWQRVDWRGSIRDPDPDNYARYEPDEDLQAIQSNADLASWFERRRAITPPMSREERLAEIAASEPYTDHDFIRDPETGQVAVWENTPNGLAPRGSDSDEPRILPRQPRPRDPGEREFFFDPNDGTLNERLDDGSEGGGFQYAAQDYN